MKTKRRLAISILIMVGMMMQTLDMSYAASGAAAGSDVIVMRTGSLKGTVIDAKGTHVSEVPVLLVDKNGETVLKTATSKTGDFTMKSVTEGDYTLEIDKDYKLNIALKEDAEASEMKVVVPDRSAKRRSGGFGVTHVLVGGVVIAVVGGLAAAGGGGGGGGGTVSP